eukprot:CAMPEP_0201583380 /NCGR_PEP_ID=MMETSP0190_2-20130828/97859_1 /ASSEMBLY_ACC=CAM_ASM_000263 /TAXON_ID=37353 /ORGANISM="Rosalina sp." /LENGTH=322 /DNA_ID=CAMNT_0048025155 /DNA_START=30 /DNA_END=995 /DNA_ORIENTATION=-
MTDLGQTTTEHSELDNLSTLKNHSDNIGSINNLEENGGSQPISIKELKCGNCCYKRGNNEDYQQFGSGKDECICRPRYICKWCCGIGTVCALLLIIIIFAGILPAVAQSSMDNASLIQVYLSMINPTKDSITMNSTLMIVNAGSFDATMEATTATLLYGGKEVGKFEQPKVTINGGTGSTFSLLTQINITTASGKALFQTMAKKILNGTDVTITFKAKPKLQPKIMGINFPKVSVNLNKDLVIPGSKMQQPYIRNFSVKSGGNNFTMGYAAIEFSIPSSLHIFGQNVKMAIYDTHNLSLGYSVIPKMSLIPGYNKIEGAQTW